MRYITAPQRKARHPGKGTTLRTVRVWVRFYSHSPATVWRRIRVTIANHKYAHVHQAHDWLDSWDRPWRYGYAQRRIGIRV